MVRTIIVPLDGSELAEQAVPHATALAQAAGAKIVFVRAILTAGEFAPGAQAYNQTLQELAAAYLEGVAKAAKDKAVDTEILVSDDEASDAILKAIDVRQADLVVMSTHGRSGLGRVVWGSIADRVLRDSSVPVFLVPKNASAAWQGGNPIRLVVPLDGSALAEEALPPAEALARSLGAEIVLVRSIQQNPWMMANTDPWITYALYADEVQAQLLQEASAYLDTIASRLNDKGITASVVLGEWEGAAGAIRRAASENQAQAIVIASHGRGGPSRMLLGSVSDEIVRTAQLPVLVVRPAAVREQAKEAASRALVAAEARNIGLLLTPSELAVTQRALQLLANGSHPEADLVTTFDLLARLQQVAETVPAEAGAATP